MKPKPLGTVDMGFVAGKYKQKPQELSQGQA
jgi:hypothetical protein